MKEPMTAEEIQALVEGHKQLGGFYDSPLKIPPKEGIKERAKKDAFHPSPTKKLKNEEEARQKFKHVQRLQKLTDENSAFHSFV